jgi:uncharacterized protein (DUF433 family)
MGGRICFLGVRVRVRVRIYLLGAEIVDVEG